MRIWRLILFVVFVWAAVTAARANEATSTRDPFWPVGFRPRDTTTVAVVETPETNAAPVAPQIAEPAKPDPVVIELLEKELAAKIRARCQVTAFLKSGGGRLIAIVNGQVVGPGDRLSVDVDGKVYKFKVTAVSPTVVRLEPVK